MPIQLIIFLTKNKIFACEINSSGNTETISIKGNSEISCEGKESIDELLECLFDAYNIDDFADDNFDIVILEAGSERELINYFCERSKNAHTLNIISIEKLLPVIANNKSMLKTNEEITVTFADLFYKLSCDDKNKIEISKARKNGDAIQLGDGDFSCLYSPSAITGVDESKLKEADLKINEYEAELAKSYYDFAFELQESEKYEKAFALYKKAAEFGSMEAVVGMGWCYLTGNGVAKDLKKAYEYLSKTAEQGIVRAQYNLGWMYYNGQGVAQDYEKAVEWYRKAAEQGDAEAQHNLGCMYYDGQGVAQDYEKAVEWYRKAAEQGAAKAQHNLGWMYYDGQGVAQDYEKAVEWYRKAAEQGAEQAQNNLGWMYQKGQGVAQDYEKAVEWYRKAAEQGDEQAQSNLGWMYQKGQGVAQDYEKAVEWYRKAAEQGNEQAKRNLKILEDYLGY